MKFNPKNKESRKPFFLQGEDNFTIIGATEKESAKHNTMCELILKRDILSYGIRCWLVFEDSPPAHYFIEQFFLSIGMAYPEDGIFELKDLIGKSGRAIFGYKRSIENSGNFKIDPERPLTSSKKYLEVKRFLPR